MRVATLLAISLALALSIPLVGCGGAGDLTYYLIRCAGQQHNTGCQ